VVYLLYSMISPYELPPENRVYIIIISVLMTLNRL